MYLCESKRETQTVNGNRINIKTEPINNYFIVY